MRQRQHSLNWKLVIGLLISVVFLVLAFRNVDLVRMGQAFKKANYWYILPAILVLFTSHALRSWRWKFLLAPIQSVPTPRLFSALMIGYMANTFLPAHLGEFLRALVLGRKEPVSASSIFGTIVIERIIDVFTLLALMALTVIVFPFPEWVNKSGYISFAFILFLFVALLLMKRYQSWTFRLMHKLTRFLPDRIGHKLDELLHQFLDGIVPLRRSSDYVIVAVQSIVIWICYMYVFQLIFHAFDFISLYSLPWTAALVLQVITTIAIVVPSSPGYVGTYHYLCMLGLGLFGVPKSPSLSFAFVMHGINFLPLLVVGLVFASVEGLSLRSMQKRADALEQ
jgi:hypothetical protein